MIAPFALGYSDVTAGVWNDALVGLVVLSFAWYRVGRPSRGIGLSWTNAVLGGWEIFAPFALGYSAIMAGVWNDVVTGVVILSLAAWSAVAGAKLRVQEAPSRSPEERRGDTRHAA